MRFTQFVLEYLVAGLILQSAAALAIAANTASLGLRTDALEMLLDLGTLPGLAILVLAVAVSYPVGYLAFQAGRLSAARIKKQWRTQQRTYLEVDGLLSESLTQHLQRLYPKIDGLTLEEDWQRNYVTCRLALEVYHPEIYERSNDYLLRLGRAFRSFSGAFLLAGFLLLLAAIGNLFRASSTSLFLVSTEAIIGATALAFLLWGACAHTYLVVLRKELLHVFRTLGLAEEMRLQV